MARSLEDLEPVAAAVHDWWFDVADVEPDEQGTAIIRLARSVKALRQRTAPTRTLEVRHVIDTRIEDTEKVETYDVAELTYDVRAHRVVLHGGVPITVSFTVSRLDVRVHAEAADELDRPSGRLSG